jgi:hypothetical protein
VNRPPGPRVTECEVTCQQHSLPGPALLLAPLFAYVNASLNGTWVIPQKLYKPAAPRLLLSIAANSKSRTSKMTIFPLLYTPFSFSLLLSLPLQVPFAITVSLYSPSIPFPHPFRELHVVQAHGLRFGFTLLPLVRSEGFMLLIAGLEVLFFLLFLLKASCYQLLGSKCIVLFAEGHSHLTCRA